jgi:hypothetical protein
MPSTRRNDLSRATHIYFDPEMDGPGGELITIVDVLVAFEGEGTGCQNVTLS